MAKVTFSTDIQSISGKLCAKEGVIYSVNKRTGKMYSAGYHGCVQPNSEKQQMAKADFKKKAQFASAWWKQNRPSSTSTNGTEAYVAVMKADKVLPGDTLLLIRPKGDGTQECYRVEGANFRGEDAYDVAKAGGYTGTRDEWVAQIQKVSMVDIVLTRRRVQ